MKNSEYQILVVDDAPMNRTILKRFLLQQGYQVVEAECGTEAIEHVNAGGIDLVMLDIMMPGMSGIEVLQTLRETYSPAELPIMMVTSKSENKDMIEALGMGANDFVVKPVNMEVTLARAEMLLRMKSATPAGRPSPVEPPRVQDEVLGPGSVLGDRYELRRVIGAGEFGTVYVAQHLGLDYAVAVKVMSATLATTPEAIADFQREGINTCRVQHPHAVSVFDFGVSAGGTPYLAMELLHGRTLQDELNQRAPLPPLRSAKILWAICDVLTAAHREGIIHRDLKPLNIFLHRYAQREIVKVVDFGIAHLMKGGANATTEDEQIYGTPYYLAPERIRKQPYDVKIDIYSLGILGYLILTGRMPYDSFGKPVRDLLAMHLYEEPIEPRTFNDRIPPMLEQAVLAAMSKNPEDRPDAESLAHWIADACELPPNAMSPL